MKVLLTFDVEIWCNDWAQLDQRFPASFQRYVWGRSAQGDYALPKTLEILARHGLKGVFFVEPLFSARFGAEHLRTIVRLIADAGQDVQLHLHPEWVDEISPPLIRDNLHKRQHLTHYNLDEQSALIGHAARLLRAAGADSLNAFRAGSFACNRDTFRALRANGIHLDSSLNACYAVSAADMTGDGAHDRASMIEGVASFPVSVFRDGFGRARPAQIAGCSAAELESAMTQAQQMGARQFVIVSHNFEMLRPGSSEPDRIVVQRFEALCRFLEARRDLMPTATFDECAVADEAGAQRPHVGWVATARRHVEQLQRRLPPHTFVHS